MPAVRNEQICTLTDQQRDVLRTVISLYTGHTISMDTALKTLPKAALHTLTASAAMSANDAQGEWRGEAPHMLIDHAWCLHSAASRANHNRVVAAWYHIISADPYRDLTEATKWAALTLFTRFLLAVARNGRPLDAEYTDVRRTVAHRAASPPPPPPAAAPQHYHVGSAASRNSVVDHSLWETRGAHASMSPPKAAPARDTSYSIFLCLEECIVLASAGLETDFHLDAPDLIRPRDMEAMYCHRLVLRVLGYGLKVITPMELIDSFFYTVVPRTVLRQFEGIVALQNHAKTMLSHDWLVNEDFGLPPAAPVTALVLCRALGRILSPEDTESQEMLRDCLWRSGMACQKAAATASNAAAVPDAASA
jgi:hypothetical protein